MNNEVFEPLQVPEGVKHLIRVAPIFLIEKVQFGGAPVKHRIIADLVFVFCFCISEDLFIKRMLASWLPYTVASVPYGTHISVFASSLISTQV